MKSFYTDGHIPCMIEMQVFLGKAGGVRVPTLDVMSWNGTPMAENCFGCYGMIS